jgi:hypothetical protein
MFTMIISLGPFIQKLSLNQRPGSHLSLSSVDPQDIHKFIQKERPPSRPPSPCPYTQ